MKRLNKNDRKQHQKCCNGLNLSRKTIRSGNNRLAHARVGGGMAGFVHNYQLTVFPDF
jgi:hypothetical protein